MEDVGGFPEFLQRVEQIEDEGDLEFFADENLPGALSIGEGHVDLMALRIAADHLGSHLANHGGLAFGEAGPHPLVLRPWGRRLVRAGGWFSAKKTFHNLLGSA